MGLTGLMAVILLVASCGGETETGGNETAEASAAVDTVPSTTAAPTTTTAAPGSASSESATAPETTAAAPETTTTAAPEPLGPPAPDFTLELGTGETFVLSEQTTPVLIIFWAEW